MAVSSSATRIVSPCAVDSDVCFVRILFMPAHRHTRENIIQTLKNIASNLGRTVLSKKDVAAHIPLGAINYHFGKLSKALEAAGLAGNRPGPSDGILQNRLTFEDLFESLLAVEQVIGHAPSMSEYRANGGTLSNRPFSDRFGNWATALQHYHKWKAEHGSAPVVPISPSVGPGAVHQQSVCAPA